MRAIPGWGGGSAMSGASATGSSYGGQAATKALQSFSLELLEEHLSTCVVDAAKSGGKEAEDKVREASDAIARLVKS